MNLLHLALTSGPAGSTDPAAGRWAPPSGWRAHESQVRVRCSWEEASSQVLAWSIKRCSGFRVAPPTDRLRLGDRFHLIARIGPLTVREPVEVVAVVEQPDRVGFAYGTLEGHPVSGEEAFIVSRREDDSIWLTLRSLTAPGPGAWGAAFPLLLLAQLWYRARYRRALNRPASRGTS